MRRAHQAGWLFLAGWLAGCAGPEQAPEKLSLDWKTTRRYAVQEATRAGKPILFAEMPGPPELAWFPETAWFVYGPLQDPRVRRVLADRFVLGWNPHGNIYGHETFHPQIRLERPAVRPEKSWGYSLCWFFATASGEIRHVLREPLDAEALLAELDRASEVLAAAPEDVPRLRAQFHSRLAAGRIAGCCQGKARIIQC